VRGRVPPELRGRSLALIYSGHQLGSILSLLLSPGLLARYGTHAMFYLYGAVGFLWLAVWHPAVPAHHRDHAASLPVLHARAPRECR
jgi:ACS family sodium-dependent inorganic phosphate cotransporter